MYEIVKLSHCVHDNGICRGHLSACKISAVIEGLVLNIGIICPSVAPCKNGGLERADISIQLGRDLLIAVEYLHIVVGIPDRSMKTGSVVSFHSHFKDLILSRKDKGHALKGDVHRPHRVLLVGYVSELSKLIQAVVPGISYIICLFRAYLDPDDHIVVFGYLLSQVIYLLYQILDLSI